MKDYSRYTGRSPVSSAIRASLVHQNVLAPHTGKDFTEAFLMGIAGGVCFGYFTFVYEGFNPQVNILTRNSFNNYGWDAIVQQLGIVETVINSKNAEIAEEKLINAVKDGKLPIVFADVISLGFAHSEFGEGMHAMQPLIVLQHDGDSVLLADRSSSPHSISAEQLSRARGKVASYRFRMITLEPGTSITTAECCRKSVEKGVKDAISLFTEAPPKGSPKNFGFAGYTNLQNDLKGGGTKSWKKRFQSPKEIKSALFTAYKYSQHFWKYVEEGGDRKLYSDFLLEVADLTPNSRALKESSSLFANSAILWKNLGNLLLPTDIPQLDLIRKKIDSRYSIFRKQGLHKELKTINKQIDDIIQDSAELPDLQDTYNQIAEQFASIAEVEKQAIDILSSSM